MRVQSKVKARYKVWPSAYASGAVAKCRKVGAKTGVRKVAVRKSKKGAALKKWFKEEWVDVKTGKPCGRKSATKSKRPYLV